MSGNQQPFGQQQQGLLPVNTTLLQPASGYYRLYDALWILNSSAQSGELENEVTVLQQQMATANANISTLQTQVSSLQGQINTINSEITTINSTLTSLQNQINTINSRLAAAGIP